MTRKSLKIGRYTEEEIFQYMTDVEGSMLGRSMYDAIFDFIHALITEKDQVKKDEEYLQRELKQKNKVIKEAIDYIKNYAREWVQDDKVISDMQRLLQILERTDK